MKRWRYAFAAYAAMWLLWPMALVGAALGVLLDELEAK